MSSPRYMVPGRMAQAAPSPELARLEQAILRHRSLLVCYSGGIDSALVLAVATRTLGDRAVGLTAVSPSLPESELADAERIARALGARHELVTTNELARPGYAANGPDRCYHCKTELYTLAEVKRGDWGLDAIANGTNLDDLGDHRPGLRAAEQAGVVSPLVEARLTKADVRRIAREIGMGEWDKPAAACLSSRIPYGTAVTPERLAQIGGLEAELRALGFRQLRVRWHDQVARVEVPEEDLPRTVEPAIRRAVVEAGRRHGFTFVSVDLAGYRQGALNELIVGKSLRLV